MNKKHWYNIHKMEYFSVMKRDEVFIYATTWMKLENIKLKKPVRK